MPPRQELGRAIKVEAGALGPPGQRHFYLHAEAEGGTATFWLEKEQLFNLAMAAQRVLAALSQRQESPPPPPAEDLGALTLDFRVARLFLSQEAEGGLFLIGVHEVTEEPPTDLPTATLSTTADQLKALSDQALEVCAAGRPPCPLCAAPMDPAGHTCVRSNGHYARDAR